MSNATPSTPNDREITTHQVKGANSLNNELALFAYGPTPNPGGANNEYRVFKQNVTPHRTLRIHHATYKFQTGPIKEAGVNGVTNEILLAIVIDRLEGFVKGPLTCEHTEIALRNAKDALDSLTQRTADRIARGVEGTYQK